MKEKRDFGGDLKGGNGREDEENVEKESELKRKVAR